MWYRSFLLPLTLLLLAGACARPPRATLDPRRTLADLQKTPARIPAGDLARTLTQVAWKDHPDLALAEAELAAARAGILTAKARPNPSFGFGATKAEGVPQPWTLTYGLNLPIETGGKRDLRIRQARLQVELSQLQVADAAWKLRMDVRRSLVDWLQAREAAAAADQEASLRAAFLKLQQRRLALGEIGTPEATLAALEAQRAAAARFTAQAEVRRAAAALALAAGVSQAALEDRLRSEPAVDLAPPPPLPASDADALIHRLDIRRTLLTWEQNETTLRQELALRVPNLQVGPGYSFDQGVKKWILGVTVDLPLFDRRQGPIAEAVARRKVIAAQLRQEEQRALSEADLAAARFTDARARLKAQVEALAAQEARLAAAKRNADLGGLDQGGWLVARLEATQARSLAVEAWAEAQRARLAVEAAFQKPLDPTEHPFRFDGVSR